MKYQCYDCWKEFPAPITRIIGYDGIQLLGWLRALFGDKSKEITDHRCPYCGGHSFGSIEHMGRKTPETLYESIPYPMEDDTPT
ncbi:hypothetical protein LCGC14_0267760 [marine sediment metagenome]|uniref:Uncharacterized protein n=1 Tax=marine sediment metagenome TaxID=412755 RepID=A0A0F9U043_9ZZZZ